MSLTVTVAQAVVELTAPLAVALESPDRFASLLADLGWQVQLTNDQAAVLHDLLPVAEQLEEMLTLAAALDDGATEEEDLIASVLDLAKAVFDAVDQLSNVSAGAIAALDAPLNDSTTWSTIGQSLPGYLLVTWLRLNHPLLFALLAFGNVITSHEQADSLPPEYILSWEALGQLLSNPGDHLTNTYGWGGDFDHGRFLAAAAVCLRAAGIDARLIDVPAPIADSHYEGTPPSGVVALGIPLIDEVVADGQGYLMLSLVAVPVPASGSGSGQLTQILLSHEVVGKVGESVNLGNGWRLELDGTADASGALGVIIGPTGATLASVEAITGVAVRVIAAPNEPWSVLGGATGTRLELRSVSLEMAVAGTASTPELALTVNTANGLVLVIEPSDTDSFLANLLGASSFTITSGLSLRWSSRDGVTFGGQAGFNITVWVDQQLGPIHIDQLALALRGGADAWSIVIAFTGSATLGPLAIFVEGLGIAATLTPAPQGSGGFGSADLTLGVQPPTGFGAVIDIEGIVTGGGFVSHDPELGRYAGALALDFLAVGLAAVVVVDTQLLGDPDGWALFASVSARVPSIPLGFGFFLSGVGGIVCLNRTMDTEALAAGLKDGAIDALLFPDNVLEDAALIISQLDAWFPQAEGSTVFGVAVTITWGAPKALVTGELGVMLSFPDLDLALVGSISMALPDEEHALLELHMDTLGTLDVSEVTVSVVASLYDSSLLRTIQLSGDMAMYGRFGADPYFLLSVGGYHPNFDPPGYLPTSVLDLRRMGCELALSEDVWFKLESYVAVTSNTLQFGAQAALEASARFLGVTYVATGTVGFDVLLVFSPFSFAADLYASVTVSAKDTELLAVSLTAHLEGPQPWYLSGSARFEFLGIGVRFDILVGGSAGVQAPPRANVLDAVVAALAAPDAWRPLAPAGQTVLLASDNEADDGIVRVRPDAALEAIQTAAPLDRALDVYGIYAIDGPNTLHIEDAGIEGAAGVTWEAVTDWFAPAMYDQLSRVEKIAAPSYEEMSAGVRLSASGVSFGNDTQSVTPDYEVRVLNDDATRPLGLQPLIGTLASVTAGLVLDRPRRQGLPRTVTGVQPFTVAAPAWTLIDAKTGIATGTPATYPAVLGQLHNRTTKDPTARGRLRMAPDHATREAT